MTAGHKWTWVLVALLGVLLLGVGRGWLLAHDEALVVREHAKANDEAQRVIAGKEAANQATLAAGLASVAQARAAVRTVDDALRVLPGVQPAAANVRAVTAGEAQAAATAAVPGAPVLHAGDLVIPEADAVGFTDSQFDCKADALKLNACTETTANQAATLTLKDERIGELETALKGGTKWQRFKAGLKWFAAGVVTAVVGLVYVVAR